MIEILHAFTIDIDPVPKGRPRVSPAEFRTVGTRRVQTRKPHAYTPATTKAYEERLAWELRRAKVRVLEGDLGLELTFHTKRGGDLDNYVKSFLDAGNGVFMQDDAQVVHLIAWLRRDVPPRIDVVIFRPAL